MRYGKTLLATPGNRVPLSIKRILNSLTRGGRVSDHIIAGQQKEGEKPSKH